jgi:general secretion pathway protein A
MYERFFSLTKAPFPLVPDSECIHLTTQHADAISGLAFGVLERRGYLVLTAGPGLGKTTAVRALSQLLTESNVDFSVILAPTFTPSEFLESVMLNFGFRDIPASKAQRLRLLKEFLVQSDAAGRILALIVDEAHRLSPELLEELRLLGNFEGADSKLLQIVLVGQLELNDLLNLPQSWPLKQRITIRLSLRPLDREAVEEYIRLQWEQAGGSQPIPFSSGAIDAITGWSNGVPRLINVICDNALLIAFSETSPVVDIPVIREACEELALPMPAITQHSPAFTDMKPLTQLGEQLPIKSVEEPQLEIQLNDLGSSLVKRRGPSPASPQPKPARSRSSILSLNEP